MVRCALQCSCRPLAPAGFYELDRGTKQFEILLVVGRILAIDLYPFPRARHTAGQKRHDVVPRKMQLGSGGGGQAQSDAGAADAGEHLVTDEIRVEAVDLARADSWELEQQSVDLCLAIRLGGIG